MIAVRAYQPGDLEAIDLQPGQECERTLFVPEAADMGPAFTITRGDTLLMVAGLVEVHSAYASAWALFTSGLGGDYAAIVRAIRRVLDASGYRRVDAMIREDWGRAHALARLLGFSKEGVSRAMGEKGEDFATYARVNLGGMD